MTSSEKVPGMKGFAQESRLDIISLVELCAAIFPTVLGKIGI